MNQEVLHLKILFSRKQTIPVEIPSTSAANEIIDFLKQSCEFSREPKLIFNGRILEPFLSLMAQGVVDHSEIVLFERGTSRFCYDNSSDLNSTGSFLESFEAPIINVTPRSRKIFSIFNEINRIEDMMMMNAESCENDSLFPIDYTFEPDDSSDEYEDDSSDDILDEFCKKNIDAFIQGQMNGQNNYGFPNQNSHVNNNNSNHCSCYSIRGVCINNNSNISNNNNNNRTRFQNDCVKVTKIQCNRVLTVLGSTPTGVSTKPLPQMITRQRSGMKNNTAAPVVASFEEFASKFFSANSPTNWKW
ncbi:hypothetical protein TRFO_21339 [Tritrichomonas foetus]|uniref:Ubiquitin-like domain-containing protein n=1 Tax=Tritrichomonas foetus TaxID=1144522 RepID=A0A1J4KJ57_9EUKA|nr:hypothetical protein TRFO_21339 [Tritrichomonas foetus]|eukprot:OHT09710.1 hypothetical protein TRFO_21339 [Tritrichomonas foetus]